MVMDREALNKPMSDFDWQVLAHKYRKNGLPTLPRRRLDIFRRPASASSSMLRRSA